MTGQFLAWTAGTRTDAEDTARRVCEDHGIERTQVVIRPAKGDGYEVWSR